MKKYKIIIVLLMAVYGISYGQQFKETITKELSFEKKSDKNGLLIANINGHIKVEGYEGDKILVEVERDILAKTNERLENGKEEIQLGIIDLADTLILYVKGTCSDFVRNGPNNHRNSGVGKGWNYNWTNCEGNDKGEYRYTMNFTVKVPYYINLAVSTINDGDISVNQVKGSVSADNINGGIKLTKLTGATRASSINGNLDLDYEMNPNLPCRFYALNGDINVLFKKGLGASVSFESFNGQFYTNIDAIEVLPVILEKKPKKNGIEYKLNGNRYKVGNGGVALDFETFNGDVFLKEI